MYLDEFNIVTDEMDNFDDALKARDAMRQKTSRRRKNEIKKKNRRKNIVKAFGTELTGKIYKQIKNVYRVYMHDEYGVDV